MAPVIGRAPPLKLQAHIALIYGIISTSALRLNAACSPQRIAQKPTWFWSNKLTLGARCCCYRRLPGNYRKICLSRLVIVVVAARALLDNCVQTSTTVSQTTATATTTRTTRAGCLLFWLVVCIVSQPVWISIWFRFLAWAQPMSARDISSSALPTWFFFSSTFRMLQPREQRQQINIAW